MKAINRPLPVSGYFEIHNKSNQVFCIKVLMQGVDVKFEIPRPSYKAGLPLTDYLFMQVLPF